MLWCEKCKSDRTGEFCNSCGSKLFPKTPEIASDLGEAIRKPINRLILSSYIALAAAAILFTVSLFIGSSIGELRNKYNDAADANNYYQQAFDAEFNAWVECKDTTYNIDDCDKYHESSRTISAQGAPYVQEMFWSEAEIGRRSGYVSLAQTLSVSALLLSGLLFLGKRMKPGTSQSGDKPVNS